MIARTLLLSAAAAAVAGPAFASGGFWRVDDSEVLDRGRCHAETWVEAARDGGRRGVVLPACRIGRVELGVQAGVDRADGETERTYELQAKTVLRDVEPGRTGAALDLMAAFDGDGRLAGGHLVAPFTRDVGEAWRLSAQVGVAWTRGADRETDALAGVSAARTLSERFTAIAELHGSDRDGLGATTGLRWTPRETLTLDVGVGRDPGERSGRLLVGLTAVY